MLNISRCTHGIPHTHHDIPQCTHGIPQCTELCAQCGQAVSVQCGRAVKAQVWAREFPGLNPVVGTAYKCKVGPTSVGHHWNYIITLDIAGNYIIT